jgi:hypothetical protein
MKFTIPFVSLIAAFALASGVAACDGGYPPPNSTPVSQCNTANTYCCDTYTSSSNPLAALLATLLGIININPSLGVGLSCTQIGINSAWYAFLFPASYLWYSHCATAPRPRLVAAMSIRVGVFLRFDRFVLLIFGLCTDGLVNVACTPISV